MEILGALGSIILIVWACATQPQRITCPRGWWLPEGVRPSGAFTCRPSPIGGEYRDARGILHDQSTQPAGMIVGQVWCEPPSMPVIATDGRTVLCR